MFRTLRQKIGIWATIIVVIAAYPTQGFSAPASIQEELEDGVVLKVHLQEDLGKEGERYARQILEAACSAYKEIVFHQGFNRSGYTFAQPTRFFAYDKDKTIDIYIADLNAPFAFMKRQGGLEYKAEIFLPADYKAYQRRYNIDNPQAELKASLAHELLHIITFSYNRNMQASSQGKISLTSQSWDWYTEGLARYFETLVGYRDEYLSYGFRKTSGKIVTVYKGGVNYFLQYPDKPLNERKYDFALFWQYLHETFGMDKIEEISFKFREMDPRLCSNQEAMEMIARTLGIPLRNLLRNFSLYVYKSSSVPGEAEEELSPVTISKFSTQKNGTYSICDFGYDFYEIDLDRGANSVQLKGLNGQKDLNCLVAIRSPFSASSMPAQPDASGKISIDTRNLPKNSKMIIMLSNPTNEVLFYRISVN